MPCPCMTSLMYCSLRASWKMDVQRESSPQLFFLFCFCEFACFHCIKVVRKSLDKILAANRHFRYVLCTNLHKKKAHFSTLKRKYLNDAMELKQLKIYYHLDLTENDIIGCFRIKISQKLTELFKCVRIWAKSLHTFVRVWINHLIFTLGIVKHILLHSPLFQLSKEVLFLYLSITSEVLFIDLQQEVFFAQKSIIVYGLGAR